MLEISKPRHFPNNGQFWREHYNQKIHVTSGPGEMIVDDARSALDTLDCSKQNLRRLEFQLTDETGTEIDLHHHDKSSSVIFNIQSQQYVF